MACSEGVRVMIDELLLGKHVVVVGSARGLGFALVGLLLRQGASVIAISRSNESLAAAQDRWLSGYEAARIHCAAIDMSSPGASTDLAQEVAGLPEIHGLVTVAGSGRAAPGTRVERMRRMFDLNLAPALNAIDALEEKLRKTPSSAIVLVSSIAGIERISCPPEYGATKASLVALASYLAEELAPVRVNAVAPGNILTDGSPWLSMQRDRPEVLEDFLSREVPLRRVAQPEEIAETISFLLASSSRFITGTTLVADGGQVRGFS
jgi:3-oxoacyl-[acyl-carrier protein] reductase